MKSPTPRLLVPLVALVYLATAVVWFLSFPLKDGFNQSDLFWEGTYLVVTISSYLVILRLGLPLLQAGWPIFTYGLLFDFLDEFTLDKDFFNDAIEDALNIFGLLLVASGFYHSYRRRVAELEQSQRAEERLRLEKSRLAATLGSIGDCVIATDLEGRITGASDAACALFQRRRGELLGEPVAATGTWLLTGLEEELDLVAGVLAQPGAFAVRRDFRVRQAGGRQVLVELAGQPIREGEEPPSGVILAFHDVTERRELEQEAVKASKLESVGLLAGGVAHDFNNIMTAIMSWSALPAGADGDPDPLEEIRQACLRGKRLSTQLMGLAKGGEPIKEPVDLRRLVLEEARFVLRGSRVALEDRTGGGVALTEADPGQISQVVHNLIRNAEQSMPDGGKVALELESVSLAGDPSLPDGHYLALRVIDQGKSIPAEHLDRLFDPYFTTKSGGHGLGLATSYMIVRRHGGRITVHSEPGTGTAFEVFLPAIEGADPAALGDAPSQVPPGCRLLLVDDDASIRMPLEAALSQAGFHVVAAASGEEGVSLYENALDRGARFDAVVMDLTMPGGVSGDKAMLQLLSLDPGACGIVASGYHDAPVLADHRSYGFRGLITKPFSAEQLTLEVLRSIEEAGGGPA